MLLIVTILVLSAIYAFLYLSKSNYNYWKKQNVPHLEPTAIFGNYSDYILLRKFIGQTVKDICDKFPKEPYVGAYFGPIPTLIVKDPEYLKLITTKDFYYFNGREATDYSHREVTTQNMFFSGGDKWKLARQSMSPLFSSAKMRNMFHLIEKCSHVFENLLDEETSKCNIVEIRGLCARFTMACICSCGFGVEVDTLGKDPTQNPFIKIGNLIFANSTIRGLALIARAVWPSIFYALGFTVFPDAMHDFFRKFTLKVFKERDNKPTTRNDFVDLILNLKQNERIVCDSIRNMKTGGSEKIEIQVTDEFLIAQCILFFAAGYETSATTLSYTFYELAKNVEAQEKIFDEVDAFLHKHDNKLVYDCVTELPYTEACIDEALRLYPVLAIVSRDVMEDYTLPDGVKLKKGMRVHLPFYYLHRNPDNFPNPEEYKPERFLAENKSNIKPYTYMPFGEGPRICIGMRFAKMQMLAGLVTILKKFRVELCEETPRSLQMDPRTIVTSPVGPIKLKLVPRDGWETRTFKA